MKTSIKKKWDMNKTWIIGGTEETSIVAQKLLKVEKDIVITVATEYGYEDFLLLKNYIVIGRMNKEDMHSFCQRHNITKIVDVSHPYAQEVSKNAMSVAKKFGIRYYRYERLNILQDCKYNKIYYVNNHTEAVELIKNKNFRRVFLTTGSNNAVEYIDEGNNYELFARIIPNWENIKNLTQNGIKAKNIIAIHGRCSKTMNIEMIKSIKADVLVTKESGKEGGFEEKIESCIETKISVIIIRRPYIKYENEYNDIDLMLSEIISGDEVI